MTRTKVTGITILVVGLCNIGFLIFNLITDYIYWGNAFGVFFSVGAGTMMVAKALSILNDNKECS